MMGRSAVPFATKRNVTVCSRSGTMRSDLGALVRSCAQAARELQRRISEMICGRWRVSRQLSCQTRDRRWTRSLKATDMLDQVAAQRVPLPGGGAFYVEPTRALVAVDVNTGGDTSLAAGLKANVACAQALPRVLRLQGLGGQIVLDLAPMPKKDRRGFEAALRQAFRRDDIETALVGWTPLGHYEMQRKRARPELRGIYS